MGSDRTRVQKSRFFGVSLPQGQVVFPYNLNATSAVGIEALPPFTLNGALYLGTICTGIVYNGGVPPRAPTGVVTGPLGQTPITAAVQNGVYGLAGPMRRPAIVRGAAWSSTLGTFGVAGGSTRHLLRLDSDGSLVRAAAGTGTATDLLTPAFALPAWNRVVFGQGTADALIAFTIGTDQTATYAADVAVPFGATPGGIGAVVQNAAGTKALAFGRDLQNRHQIAQSSDGAAWAALTETPISVGNPLRVADALALPAANGNPAVMLALCTLGGASGPVRLLRTADDGGSFALIPVTSSASTAAACELAYVNGILFIFTSAGWFYSTDHGATIRAGSAQVVNPGRVDWDGDLRCYVMHSRVGAVAVLTEAADRQLTYIGTVPIPGSEQLTVSAAASMGSFTGTINYGAPGVTCATAYSGGTVYGLAINRNADQAYATLAYAYPLALLRLPKGETATVTLRGGGGYGEFFWSNAGALNLWPSSGFDRVPAGSTRLLGYGAAPGGAAILDASLPGEGKVWPYPGSYSSFPASRVAGAPAATLGGVPVAGGGSRDIEIASISASEAALIGGSQGGAWECRARAGDLLVITVGSGGRIQRRLNGTSGSAVITQLYPLSSGMDGGALVEWEEWQ